MKRKERRWKKNREGEKRLGGRGRSLRRKKVDTVIK